ncbi:TRAP transporter TatT component family protein [Gynuella sp.]|uniref:TRAP transporter TatT component family protein n=1 Tax=Gynuella sp. TaxID=2969146 RepID=UPI003D0DB19C
MSRPRVALLMLLSVWLSGCSVNRLPESLGYGVLNNDDLETVREGLPTYLLVLDGAVINYPRNDGLLRTASDLNGAYASLFVKEKERRVRLIDKSLKYAQRQMCVHKKRACGLETLEYGPFQQIVQGMDRKKDLEALYTLGSAWAGYIQEHSDDWNAIADLAKVELIMKQVVAIDESYSRGQALLYLGVMNSLIPPGLGGKPEVAREYFERGIELSQGRNLIIKVKYAEKYARLVFDQDLHDRLLREVIAADPEENGLTLQNHYAQQLAQELLAESNDYF